jgi:Cu/Zn superoxide dismutase
MNKSLKMTAAIAAALFATAAPTFAQIAPTDTGAGAQRGTQEMNNSGQVGTVTLFRHGSTTTVVLNIKSSPSGHEAARIFRGKSCDFLQANRASAYTLNDVVNGHSRTTVNATGAKLLSENYVVIVHAGTSGKALQHEVSCGRLYAASDGSTS